MKRVLGLIKCCGTSCSSAVPSSPPIHSPKPMLHGEAACAGLGGCVLVGTFLSSMSASALEGLLVAGEVVPSVGEVCKALRMLKEHADSFHSEGGGYLRLSVWCVHFSTQREREFFIDNLLVRIHFIIVMIRWTGLAPWEL